MTDLPEGLIDWVFENCNDRPDLLVELRDLEGWTEKDQRLYVCDAARRELKENGFDWPEMAKTVYVATNYANGDATADADTLKKAHDAAVEINDRRPASNRMLLFTIWACQRNAHNAAVMTSKQAWIDAESTKLAAQSAMRAGAMATDQDDAKEFYAVGGRLAGAHTEAFEQCDYLRRTRK